MADRGTVPSVMDTEQGIGKKGEKEDGMDISLVADQNVVELENREEDSISVPLSGLLNGLSSREAEEEEEEDEQEMNEESGSLACGQGVVRSLQKMRSCPQRGLEVKRRGENVSSPLPTHVGVGACS